MRPVENILARILTVFAVAAFAAAVYLSVKASRPGKTLFQGIRRPPPAKMFSTGVAEGFRYHDFENFGIDLLAFESCRVEKMRRGVATFGAFNVLVLDNVTVNLPEVKPGAGDAETPATGEGRKPDMADMDDFTGLFTGIQGLAGKKFSGLRVNGLGVNRLAGGKMERLFSVELAESVIGQGGYLRVEGCVVYSPDGAGEIIGPARIELKPAPALVYKKNGVEQRLPLRDEGRAGSPCPPGGN